ncbi:lysosomal acid glucosylceramidase-like [Leptidea sinapis]|uniref:lysosomal acid glucosylceramidase-like n=1 Tax=Leptidea sinapis TaxID=189913 RepID=UPI002130BF30|nr:lysosomal acid glucosylceramidase-like [Leptidea sinapis]
MLKFFSVLILVACVRAKYEDKPCASKQIPGESVVCVCNATYCDELQRSIPSKDTFYVYTSSEGGLRFQKQPGTFEKSDDFSKFHFVLHPKKTYQKIQGFGGAVSDAAGINWKSLPPKLRKSLIDSYYGIRGLEYNMARVPIGGSDFSTHPYAYNESPVNDTHLTNFTLAPEDFQYKLPMIHQMLGVSKVPLDIVATTWSPPPWMKTNNAFTGYSRLRKEYYQTYADYHLKFLQTYKSEGVPIWGITTTNEPINGVLNLAPFNTLGWTPGEMGEWIVNNLGPTIRNSEFKDLNILTCDDQRVTIPLWFNILIMEHPEALKYIDGIAVHYYTDKFSPADILDLVTKNHPDKFILGTEACEGSYPWESPKVLLGSWDRAKTYVTDIIKDLNHNIVGWIDWNLCLDSRGGPNWAKNFVDSPIIVFADKQEFYKQPMYYALGHITKFVPKQSYRIAVETSKTSVKSVAFVTPRNTTVIVMYNDDDKTTVNIKRGERALQLTLAERSIVTLEMYNSDT